MRVLEMTIRKVVNIGNYETRTMEVRAAKDDGESVDECFSKLNELVNIKLGQVIDEEQNITQ